MAFICITKVQMLRRWLFALVGSPDRGDRLARCGGPGASAR